MAKEQQSVTQVPVAPKKDQKENQIFKNYNSTAEKLRKPKLSDKLCSVQVRLSNMHNKSMQQRINNDISQIDTNLSF
jgi:hypothetical protein